MKWNKWIINSLKLLGISLAFPAFSYDEPAVNLGYTSFFDGSPPAGPGPYFQNYLQFYSTNRLTDNNGNRLPLPKTDVDITANIMQLIYLSTKKVLGGKIGVSALLPWVTNASTDDGLNNAFLNARTGPGDLFIGPAIQYDPIMRKDGKSPFFVQRFEVDFVVPVGEYNRYFAINPSSNFWSINPYWAMTVWMTQKWSTSMRLHYLWNAKNHDPNISFGPFARTSQAGQAVFANIAISYQLAEKFFLGVNGYFFNQFTDTKVNNVDVPGRKEKVWAIGPGALYSITKNNFLFFNFYSEQDARNRPQGTNAILRYAVHFG